MDVDAIFLVFLSFYCGGGSVVIERARRLVMAEKREEIEKREKEMTG